MSDPELRARVLAAVRAEPRPPTRADLLRRDALSSAGATLAATALILGVATAAGLAAAWLVDQAYPTGHEQHLLIGHVAPLVVFAILGWVCGLRVDRGRYEATYPWKYDS